MSTQQLQSNWKFREKELMRKTQVKNYQFQTPSQNISLEKCGTMYLRIIGGFP